MKISNFTKGLIKENPTFFQLLGMCPTLAVTTSMQNGIGMGISTTVVLIMSNLIISLLKKLIPKEIRIPIFIVVIATFVSIIEMVLHGYVKVLYDALGLFIPLIVVNCIILARAESFAFTNGALDSILDGAGMGLGFTMALGMLGFVRELLGTGGINFFGIQLLNLSFLPKTISMILPPGAFLVLGLMLAVNNQIKRKKVSNE